MAASGEETKLVINQHYDESLEVNDSEEVASAYTPSPRKTPTQLSFPLDKPFGKLEHPMTSDTGTESPDDLGTKESSLQKKEGSRDDKARHPALGAVRQSSDGDSDDDEDSSSTDDDDDNAGVVEGAYDPADYDHLTINQEIKELFQYITRYTPQTIELEHKLKPFNPDYIPAVGDIDAFLKVSRPDHNAVTLGLTVLDEPCAKQSDPTVLDLQLRSISKTTGVRAVQVRSVKDANRNPKAIDKWIESMEELHRSKPPQNVHYTKRMPDIDFLMQEWPPEMEELLSKSSLPSSELDCSLHSYVDLICSILDIPVHKNRVQSLHVLFSLYSAFKELHHFQTGATSSEDQIGVTNEAEVLHFE